MLQQIKILQFHATKCRYQDKITALTVKACHKKGKEFNLDQDTLVVSIDARTGKDRKMAATLIRSTKCAYHI